MDSKTFEGIYWKYKAALLELHKERDFWSALNETIESAYEALHNSEHKMKLHLMLTPSGSSNGTGRPCCSMEPCC
jgi:hypothetical protein